MNDPAIIAWLNSDQSHHWRRRNFRPLTMLATIKYACYENADIDGFGIGYEDELFLWLNANNFSDNDIEYVNAHIMRTERELKDAPDF